MESTATATITPMPPSPPVKHLDGSLPDIISARAFVEQAPEPPGNLVPGLFHREGKLSLGGGSKTHKSWAFADLAMSLASGTPWLGLPTVKSRVLYLNFEIPGGFFLQRVRAIAESKDIDPRLDNLDFWHLRGCLVCYKTLKQRLVEEVDKRGCALVIIDPIYKLYGKTDENAAGDVAELLNTLDAVTRATTASVAFAAHFSKGNQSTKEAIDRISGSGVFGRDPDTILSLTPHKEPNCFTVDAILRNMPPMESFVVEWRFPRLIRAPHLDPKCLKPVLTRPRSRSAADLLPYLGVVEISTAELVKAARLDGGISSATTYALIPELGKLPGVTRTAGGKWMYVPRPED